MLLIDYARNELGLPMRGLYIGTHYGWTTDEAKNAAFLAAGGQSTHVRADTGRSVGFEIRCSVGAEMDEAVAA